VSQYQKSETNLDFTEARDSEWQWHQLGHMQVCTSLQTDNHARTPPLSFLQAVYHSCHPTNSVKALKAMQQRLHSAINTLTLPLILFHQPAPSSEKVHFLLPTLRLGTHYPLTFGKYLYIQVPFKD